MIKIYLENDNLNKIKRLTGKGGSWGKANGAVPPPGVYLYFASFCLLPGYLEEIGGNQNQNSKYKLANVHGSS